ncbi:J domain-containing protein [Paracraurococcus ruber]|uniref:J domain-containing protein n=1 Tax=Paracraurococcus ruber TaxID=77675 RepID=A0ABS1D6Z9_9PROT|nr:molecular chaperone DnaJ [Paracraurococcus ruber]MBK1662341.1 hypothetical protein [Paracraurococcus ruber]TDG17303.1 molecular chaperone DnaJ [Paracraurococcus ruber]
MVWLAVGAGLLLLALWLLRLFATARVETIRKGAIWGGAAMGGVLLLVLLSTGRGAQLLWSLGLFAPLAWRWGQGWIASRRFRRSEGMGGGAGGESAVETATLAMRLDHATGRMTGQVRRGRQAGRELAALTLVELLALLAECRSQDPESVPLLEAWLDRVEPDWREAEAAPPPGAAGPGRMTREEALQVLGLAEGATEEQIRAAHRRLMRAAHPDQGGSDWLAARINQARDLLLG